ncbi:unnamed protein product [Acanthosepion pharaonis]|uniref:Uncharacterized protein n=1 Tax=Acanthosepion pharaonis TaxID=158019 RepID=A0A812CEX4_ACAPH|nr:unnamed protein product [Sepia pharaonis]
MYSKQATLSFFISNSPLCLFNRLLSLSSYQTALSCLFNRLSLFFFISNSPLCLFNRLNSFLHIKQPPLPSYISFFISNASLLFNRLLSLSSYQTALSAYLTGYSLSSYSSSLFLSIIFHFLSLLCFSLSLSEICVCICLVLSISIHSGFLPFICTRIFFYFCIYFFHFFFHSFFFFFSPPLNHFTNIPSFNPCFFSLACSFPSLFLFSLFSNFFLFPHSFSTSSFLSSHLFFLYFLPPLLISLLNLFFSVFVHSPLFS